MATTTEEEVEREIDTTRRGLIAFLYSDTLRLESENQQGNVTETTDRGERLYKQESIVIREKLKSSSRHVRFWLAPATIENLRSRLDHGCQVLHYAGHGLSRYLNFEDTTCCGAAQKLQAGKLRSLFAAGGVVPDLVVFGSCESEMCGRAVAEAGVPHVVAVKAENGVSGLVAQEFCATFYEKLIIENLTVQKAFDAALHMVEINEEAPFLLLPEDKDHNVRIFDDLPRGEVKDETPPLPPMFFLPATRKPYLGDVKPLQYVLSLLTDTACLTITGKPGIGKTEMALQVGSALDMSPAPSSPSELWEAMLEVTKKEIGHLPTKKILLVVDGADALYEGGGREARASLATFVDALCCTNSNLTSSNPTSSNLLQVLVTSENGILEATDQCLSNSVDWEHPVEGLGGGDLSTLLQSLNVQGETDFYADGLSTDEDAGNEDRRKALLEAVKGNPGALCHIASLRERSALSDPEVEQIAVKYLNRFREEPQNRFSTKRAYEVSTEERLKDKRCRDIWVNAITKATGDDRGVGDGDDACYRLVRWSYLSLALNSYLRGIQTASSARDLDYGELCFIFSIVRKFCTSSDKDENSVDESEKCRIFTGFATAASVRQDKDADVSLKEFRRVSKHWLGRVLATLSRMRKDWSIHNPVRVRGFVSRSEAERQLLKKDFPGVFLLRFSESHPGRLVLCFTREVVRKTASTSRSQSTLFIQESLVTVLEDGRWTLHENEKFQSGKTYGSLQELVLGNRSLKTLYPDIPKEIAFSTTSTTSRGNLGLNSHLCDESPRGHG